MRALDLLDRRVRDGGALVVARNVGLLAPYSRLDVVERWRDDLKRATHAEEHPAARVMVLVPGRDREQLLAVDGAPIPVVTAGQWVRVSAAWLERAA